MIGAFIHFVTLTPEQIDFQKEIGVMFCQYSQRFKITSAGCLHMDTFSPMLRHQWIYTELIGTRMQTQFVCPKIGSHCGMLPKFGIQRIQVTDVIYAFLKATNEAWRKRGKEHIQAC